MSITAKEAKELSAKFNTNSPSNFDLQLIFICQRIEKTALRGLVKAQFLPTEFTPELLPETKGWLESNGFEVENVGSSSTVSWEDVSI